MGKALTVACCLRLGRMKCLCWLEGRGLRGRCVLVALSSCPVQDISSSLLSVWPSCPGPKGASVTTQRRVLITLGDEIYGNERYRLTLVGLGILMIKVAASLS